MRFTVQMMVTIEVESDDGRNALPAATDFFQEAMDWALEHYEGNAVQGVTWQPEILRTVGE